MDIQRMFFEGVVFSPNKIEQFLARQHAPGVLQEDPKNLEFLRGQLDRLFLDSHLVAIEIHGECIHSKFPGRRGLKLLSPEQRLDDGQPFSVTV